MTQHIIYGYYYGDLRSLHPNECQYTLQEKLKEAGAVNILFDVMTYVDGSIYINYCYFSTNTETNCNALVYLIGQLRPGEFDQVHTGAFRMSCLRN